MDSLQRILLWFSVPRNGLHRFSANKHWLRRAITLSVAAGAALIAICAPAQQAYPDRPIRLIVPFVPGGLVDTGTRAIADRLGVRLGQQMVVENRAGASGNIGADMVAKAPADGYMLLLSLDSTLMINPHISKLPFDTLRDFAPITKLGEATLILVAHPSVPAKNLAELIAKGKSLEPVMNYQPTARADEA
jgi:tripartite-type tricarboxylate transporter receptor subunit TctC